MSSHLTRVKQNYWPHFLDAMSYSFMAFRASFYFFVHAIFPDLFEFDGSKEIEQINNIIAYKRKNLNFLFK